MKFIERLYKDDTQLFVKLWKPVSLFVDWVLGSPLDYRQRLKETEDRLKKKYPNYGN